MTAYVLRLIAATYLFFLVAWPVSLVAVNTFDGGLASIQDALRGPRRRACLRLSVYVAVVAVVINLVFGVGVSLLLVRQEFPGKRVLSALIDLPLSVSPIVVGLALSWSTTAATGWFGPDAPGLGLPVIFATPGMIMATSFVALPLVIREVVPVLEEIGDEQEQAAESLGANAAAALLAHHPAAHQVGA